jgi:hypothetical protein
MTHAELVARAVRWLRGYHRCGVVFAEMTTRVSETPDAIGWRRGSSIVVECKRTRSDFHRDRDKPHARVGRCMGTQRWYLAPAGVLRAGDMPEGIGLAEARSGRVIVVRRAEARTDRDVESEIELLTSAVTRAHLGVRFDHLRARWEPMLATEARRLAERETADVAGDVVTRCAL